MGEISRYSPYRAFYGFDRTHIKRLSLLDYMREDEDDSSSDFSQCRADDIKRQRGLLTSQDPNVVFRSQFPVRDHLGRELCVLYQIIESEIEDELRRVKGEGRKVALSSVTCPTTAPSAQVETSRPFMGYGEGQCHVNGAQLGQGVSIERQTGLVDANSSFEVSASTQRFSTTIDQSRPRATTPTSSACDTVRLSSFTVYRDSGLSTYVGPLPPPVEVSGLPLAQQQQHDQLLSRSEVMSDGRHSLFPLQLVANGDFGHSSENEVSQLPSVAPPQRSSTASPLRWHSIAEDSARERDVNSGASSMGCNMPYKLSADGRTSQSALVHYPEARTTQQLFPSSHASASPPIVRHPVPIPTNVYGTESQTIPAARVLSFVNTNVEAFCAGGEFYASDVLMPQLAPGKVLVLEGRFYRIVCYRTSADVYEAQEMSEGPTEGVPSVSSGSPVAADAPPQVLIYRWNVRAMQEGINEAQRAALGLFYATCGSSSVRVAGYRYSDGGLTVMTLPRGYRAVPLSLLPLSPDSFPTCVRLILKMLLDLVARRTVHGNLYGLNHIFFALPEGGDVQDVSSALLIPVHWERLVDFSMFVDRNAGRTVPLIDGDDCLKGEYIFHGHDVATLGRALLDNENAIHFHQQQVERLCDLVSQATGGTQIATYLVQLNSAVVAIPADPVALISEFKAALRYPY